MSARKPFIDAVRGLAVVLMVINHTARWWREPSAGGREAVIYGSMVLAGPTFLFLVGVSLALSWHAALTRGDGWPAVAGANLRRALVIVGCGVLVNVLVFPDDVLTARVLMSIGLMIAIATPLLPLLDDRAGRAVLLGLAALGYAAFLQGLPTLAAWSATHPVAAALLFREFPVLPWLSLILIGLVVGWAEARDTDARRRDRRYLALGAAGLAGLIAYWRLDPATPLAARLAFGHDPVLNDYWTAGPVTAVGMLGAVFAVLAATYGLVERAGRRMRVLVWLGRTALMIYVVHLVLVVPLGRDAGHLAFAGWATWAVATGALLALLAGFAAVWLRLRPGARPARPEAPAGVIGEPGPERRARGRAA